MKVSVEKSLAYRFFTPGSTVLVTSASEGKTDILTVSWQTPVAKEPPLLAIAVAKPHYSHELLTKGLAYVINLPTKALLKEVMYCGTRSGREVDKFEETRLTPEPGDTIDVPHIRECAAYVECRVTESLSVGDHTLFIGEALKAEAEAGLFDQTWKIGKPGTEFLQHLGGPRFFLPGPPVRGS